ncbi:MAG: hypothetical protein NZ561_10885 [Phycisphaerae bacterium]|nr:hypothetical protein [Phycisphaerae bacterium]
MIIPPVAVTDRFAALSIVGLVLLVYGWFFQGDGWAHHAHYSTIRSLVERGTFEITPFAALTGDVAVVDGRIYSNKPPGAALIGAPIYWLVSSLERFVGLPPNDPAVDRLNQAILTLWLSSLPGAATAGMICLWFRRLGSSVRSAARLALAFAFGSIVFPFSGTIFNHVLVMALLLGAWLLMTAPTPTPARTVGASLLLGLATISEYLAAPLAVILIAGGFWVHRSWRRAAMLAAGPVLAAMGLLAYHQQHFGGPLIPSYAHELRIDRELAQGDPRFNWPDWRRLYWITWHRMRGLFYCSPIFALALLAPLLARRKPDALEATALAVIGFYLLFYLTYASWLGGHGVGPRFAIPALPFLLLFVRRPAERFPRIAALLVALSVANMLAVTAVQTDFTGNEAGVPQHWDPVGVSMLRLLNGQVALSPNSYNLGLLLGLRGAWSVIPALGLILVAFGCTFRIAETAPPGEGVELRNPALERSTRPVD